MGRFSSLVYAVIVVLVMLFVFITPPPAVSDFINRFVCVPYVEMQNGELVIGEQLPNFVLNWGTGMRSYTEIIELDHRFYEPPEITVSIVGIDSPVNPPRIDVEVVDVGPYQFALRVTTWDDSVIRFVRINWLAVELQCSSNNIVKGFRSPLFGTGSSYSPNWNLNAQDVGERSYSLEHRFDPLDAQPTTLLSLSGVDFGESRSNILAFWPWEVSPGGFQSTISTWDDGRLDSLRLSSLNFAMDNIDNIHYETELLTLGIDETPHWQLDLPSDMFKTHKVTVPFSRDFLRIPWIFLSVSGFDTGESPLRVSCFVEETTFTDMELVIKIESYTSLKYIDINYLAFDVREIHWTVIDSFLLAMFILCLSAALVWEAVDKRKVAKYVKDPSIYAKGKVAKGTLEEELFDPPERFDKKHRDTEKLKEMMETIHRNPEENFASDEEVNEDLMKKKLNKSMQDSEAEWVAMLRSFDESSKFSQKTKRSKAETTFLIGLAFAAVIAMVWFFKDYILANKWFHRLDSFTLSAIILGLEYCLLGAALFTQSWPSVRTLPRNHRNVAILIASHASAGQHPDAVASKAQNNIMGTANLTRENLTRIQQEKEQGFEKTLKMASMLVPDGQVFVCHNSRGAAPAAGDRTIDVVSKVAQWGRKISYVYVPVGNKTLALLWTAKYWLPPNIDTVVIMDDDIILPPDMSFQINKLSNKSVAGAVPIIRTAPNKDSKGFRRRSLLVWMQDVEYLLAGFSKLFQSSWSTANYPHGAVSIWKRDVMVEVMERHNTVFNGEDAQMGLILREMTKEKGDMQMLLAYGNTPVLTSVPEDLCHPGEDLFNDVSIDEKSLLAQRIKSWDVTAHRFLFKYLQHLLFYWSKKTIVLKFYYLHEILTIIQDYLRILVMIYFVYLNDVPSLIVIAARVVLIQYCLFFIFNFWTLRRRRDLRAPLLVIIIFPLYRLLLLAFRVVALFYNLFEYVPRSKNFDRLVDDPSRLPPYHPVLRSLVKRNRDWHRVWNCSEFDVDEEQNVTKLYESSDDVHSSEVSVSVGEGLTDSELTDEDYDSPTAVSPGQTSNDSPFVQSGVQRAIEQSPGKMKRR
ncbi:hypothetical protein P9112_004692 [Eukaryota sp. TZLM1-RC]